MLLSFSYPYQTTFESYEGRNGQYNDPHYNSVNEKQMCYGQSENPVQVHKGQNYPSQYAGQNLYYQNQNSENSTQDSYFLDLRSLTPKQPI